MCTLIVAVAPDPARALLVAANRDEDLDRPAEGPRLRRFGEVRVVAPLDLEGGGTWMGISEWGLFAGLTNRFGIPRAAGRRSRGEVVVEALQRCDVKSAFEWASELDPKRENAFHLVVADRSSAFKVVADGTHLSAEPLGPGVHVVTERAFGAAPSERQRWLEARLSARDPAELTLDGLAALLRDHAGGPFDGVCVHVPARNYGTRSAALLEIPKAKGLPVFWAAGGPPCTHPFERVDTSGLAQPSAIADPGPTLSSS